MNLKVASGVLYVFLVLTSVTYGAGIPFANYGVINMTDQPLPGQFIWSGDYADQTWASLPHDVASLPGWDAHATQAMQMQLTSGLSIDEDLIATASFITTTTWSAHDDGGVVLGTLVLNEVTENGLVDVNASRAVVDEKAGTIRLRSGSPLNAGQPITDITLVNATGVFAGIEQRGPWHGYYSGHYVKPLLADMDLQQNIFDAPFIGGFFETAVTGVYAQIPEPSGAFHPILGLATVCWLVRRRKIAREKTD